MRTYEDRETGYTVRVLTEGAAHTKPYFDNESTTPDDARAFATEVTDAGEKGAAGERLWLVDVDSGDRELLIELKSHAEKAEERMYGALELVDVPVRSRARADCSIVLQARESTSPGPADYLLDIDIREYGVNASSSTAVHFRLSAMVHLRDTRDGVRVWERRVNVSEQVSPEILGVPDVVSDVLSVAVLAELSVDDIARGFEPLAREAARQIAGRLDRDLARERQAG